MALVAPAQEVVLALHAETVQQVLQRGAARTLRVERPVGGDLVPRLGDIVEAGPFRVAEAGEDLAEALDAGPLRETSRDAYREIETGEHGGLATREGREPARKRGEVPREVRSVSRILVVFHYGHRQPSPSRVPTPVGVGDHRGSRCRQ
jgi:hypothetical protein